MTHAIVAHHYWNRPGGSQLLIASAAYALAKQRDVTLAATVRFDPAKYIDWFGIDLTNLSSTSLPMTLSMFALYTRLLVWYPIQKAIKPSTDIVFLDESGYLPLLRRKRRDKFKLIEYVHFPMEISLKQTGRSDPYVTERYGRFPLNVYWASYLRAQKIIIRKNPFEAADRVLTNSKWTARIVKETYGEMPVVLNPPVPPNAMPTRPTPSFDARSNNIVMVGRFSEEKRYRWVIENIATRIKGMSKLFIFGGAGSSLSLGYKNRLMSLATKLGIKVSTSISDSAADLYLVSEAPRSEINTALDRAKVFLHSTVNEHWGIVVTEAMARGVPILVQRSGGAWSDLAEEGKNGLGYDSSEEAIELISALCSDKAKWRIYQQNGLTRVKELTLENFSDSLSRLVPR